MKSPNDYHPKSLKKVLWICDCGKEKEATVCVVHSGSVVRCGKCLTITPGLGERPRFGRMTMVGLHDYSPGSTKLAEWDCDCGLRTMTRIADVVRGKASSCGRCFSAAVHWYVQNEVSIRALHFPINPGEIPEGWFRALETITASTRPFLARCGSCHNLYRPIWNNIRRGMSLTCGCASARVSKGQSSMASFIRSLGLTVHLEHPVAGLRYDMFIPSHNLLVEYNGLKWHSVPGSKARDMGKFRHATERGFGLVMVYSDEWEMARPRIESFFRNRLNSISPRTTRPSKCTFFPISSRVADEFHGLYHYIGASRSNLHYGAFSDSELVACISFRRPTRKSIYDFELSRMSSNPDVRIHGVWSKLFTLFQRSVAFRSLVSFSDNRLFSGSVYSHMGFSNDGHVPMDYYWTDGIRRFHKSSFRKTPEERGSGVTEDLLRKRDGYSKVWDFGKTRWVFRSS